MKRLSCKILALICILVVLFGCGGVIGTVVASSDGQDEHSWWVFPPEGFEDVTVSANAGKRLRVASGSCETILPSNVNRDFLALYVRVTLSEAVADALNEEG